MAITNHERVGKALEFLKSGLGSFVEREFKSAHPERAAAEAGYKGLVQSWPEIPGLAREAPSRGPSKRGCSGGCERWPNERRSSS